MRIRPTTNKNLVAKDTFTIDRGRWVFGGDFEDVIGRPRMLNEKGKMCCLGQICHEMGVGKDTLKDRSTPRSVSLDLKKDIPLLVDDVYWHHTDLSKEAMHINDGDMPLLKRERRLKALFKKNGITLKFTGRYPEGVLAGKRRR